jgi:ABC-2 type transport system ATP-binding protein
MQEAEMLEIGGLRKSYGEHGVLRGVDLRAEPGEILGLLGPNGAGKTTLVSIVAGLRRADAGTVTVDGVDALARPERAREVLGLAPQDLGIYPGLSVVRNLAFFAELAGLSGAALRERVAGVAAALDLEPLLGTRASTLSGGQKRRLHTAMALVHRPKVLFLDEPTVGADVRSRGRILEVVRSLAAEGCTVVYTSHYLNEIEELGATVAVLETGTIVARGALEDLVAEHGSPALRLTFDGPAPALEGFEVEGSVATLHTADPARAAAGVLDRLNGDGTRLRGVDIVRPSLEAAYLALTGRRSNDETTETSETDGREDHDDLVA